MKKASILLLCFLLALSCLTACGRDKNKNEGSNNAPDQNGGMQNDITDQRPDNNTQTPGEDIMDGAEDIGDGIADGVRGLWDGLTDIFDPNDLPRTVEGDADAFAAYGLSDDLIEAYILQSPENADVPHEFFIAKVKEGKMAEVEEILQKRKEVIAANWAETTAEGYDYAKSPVIYKSGNYIMLAVHENTEDIRTEFERLVGELEKK